MIKEKFTIVDVKEKCVGCTACSSICSQNAIKMISDEEGFKYPKINFKKCINCYKCIKICPARKDRVSISPLSIYAAQSKDKDIRNQSTSGGVFSHVADYFERMGGIIYGVGFDQKMCAVHMRAQSREEWEKFCTSKYMQSDLKDSFKKIKEDLVAKKKVLFSGTPCQVDGLISYLGKIDTRNLYTIDIVCHGVPSPKIWLDYLKYVNRTKKKKVSFVNFRFKGSGGWHGSTILLKSRKDDIVLNDTQENNLYFKLFFNHFIIRPSCHECKYANFSRPGDLSLGDYWGCEKYFPYFDDNIGTSLVICNTLKGLNIKESIEDSITWVEINQEQAVQPNLEAPSWKNPKRKEFWSIYRKKGFMAAVIHAGFLSFQENKLLMYYHALKNKLIRYLKNSRS